MVKGKVLSPNGVLSIQNILERASSYSIYRFYTGVNFEIGVDFCNPFRKDYHPSFSIKAINGDLHHFDYKVDYWRGRCFDLVAQIYGCDYKEVLGRINRDFNLGLGGELIIPNKKPVITWEEPKELKQSVPPLITFRDRPFNKRELDYWSKLGVGEQDIKKDNIYAPEVIYINYKRHIIPLNELCFVYHYPDDTRTFKDGSVAIYRPEADKKHKWYKNVSFTYVEHLDKLDGCDKGFLAKSKKGRLFMRNILETDCIATVQAENPSCLSEPAIQTFMKCKERFAIGDNDKTGKEFTWWLTNNYGVKHINAPDHYYINHGWSDFEDIAMNMVDGYKIVKDYFKEKNLCS
jgi:hypothetical protein